MRMGFFVSSCSHIISVLMLCVLRTCFCRYHITGEWIKTVRYYLPPTTAPDETGANREQRHDGSACPWRVYINANKLRHSSSSAKPSRLHAQVSHARSAGARTLYIMWSAAAAASAWRSPVIHWTVNAKTAVGATRCGRKQRRPKQQCARAGPRVERRWSNVGGVESSVCCASAAQSLVERTSIFFTTASCLFVVIDIGVDLTIATTHHAVLVSLALTYLTTEGGPNSEPLQSNNNSCWHLDAFTRQIWVHDLTCDVISCWSWSVDDKTYWKSDKRENDKDGRNVYTNFRLNDIYEWIL